MNKKKQISTAGQPITPEPLIELMSAYRKSQVLIAAFQLEIFTHLGSQQKTSAQIAQLCGADARATDRLLNALCALNLLQKQENLFTNTPITEKFLVQSSPNYMGGIFQHNINLWQSWSTLTDAVRQGSSVIHKEINNRDDQWLGAFIGAMHNNAAIQAEEIVNKIDLTHVTRVLDVGGGSGAYSIAFVNAGENIHATVFDLPNVISLTKQYIQEAGLTNKIDTCTGDYRTDALGTGYDLVFLSSIVHINSPDENSQLIKRSATALNPGGQVVVRDFIMSADRTQPPGGTLFALNMLVGTEAGDTYTQEEMKGWMESAGLKQLQLVKSPFGPSLMIGRK